MDFSKDDGGELGRLMHDFRVHELKETEKGVEHMCKEMEQLYDELIMDEKKETARNLKAMGLSIEQIAQALKVNVQLVQDWLSGAVTTAR